MDRLGRNILAGAAAACILATGAFAQPAPPSAPAVALGTASDATGKRAKERMEKHITELNRTLGITTAQQPQWEAFTAVMRQNAQRMETTYNERLKRTAPMSAVDDLKAYAALERARAEDVDRLIPRFEALYQAMSPEQRATADKNLPRIPA